MPKTTSIMTFYVFVDSRTFFNLFYAKYGSKKQQVVKEWKDFPKAIARKNGQKWPIFAAKIQRAEKEIYDHILICIYKVYNHSKFLLYKTQLDKTTSNREMARFSRIAKMAALANYAKSIDRHIFLLQGDLEKNGELEG